MSENDEDNNDNNEGLFDNLDINDFSSESEYYDQFEEHKNNTKKKSVVKKTVVPKKFSTPSNKLTYNQYLFHKNNINDNNKKKESIKRASNEKINKITEERKTKEINLFNAQILETPEDNYENFIDGIETKKNYLNKNITKVKNSHNNLYEREKQYLIRKNNSLKKKQELKIQKQLSNLKDPSLNQVSRNILTQNNDYIPIQQRSSQFYNLRKFHNILNENKIQIQKKEKENKEAAELKKYKSQKKFNERDWNNFIENQKYWQKLKSLKKKAVELMRENIEINIKHKPKIDRNSERIINNMRKTVNYQDDIYNKLYNDFDNLKERNKYKIYCSMPSFKPIINRGIKKNLFKNNKFNENSKNNNRSMEKQIESIIQKHLKNLKNKNNNANKDKIEKQIFENNISGINFNSLINNKTIKNANKGNYNNRNKNLKKSNKTQNLSMDSYLYKKIMDKKSSNKK